MMQKIFKLLLSLVMSMTLVVGCLAQKDKKDEKPPKPPERVIEREKPKPTPPPDKKRPNEGW